MEAISLTGRTAVITGAGRGLCFAYARMFGARGAGHPNRSWRPGRCLLTMPTSRAPQYVHAPDAPARPLACPVKRASPCGRRTAAPQSLAAPGGIRRAGSPLPAPPAARTPCAEPISDHGCRDTEDLADAGLPATDPVGSVSGGREGGNQMCRRGRRTHRHRDPPNRRRVPRPRLTPTADRRCARRSTLCSFSKSRAQAGRTR